MTVLILLGIFIFPLIKADCLSLTISRLDYLPLETAQVEINSNSSRNLTNSDIFLLSNEMQQSTLFYLVKLSSNKYFLFFDVPKEVGSYQLKIKTVCNGQYQFFTQTINVKEPVEPLYESVKAGIQNNLYGIPLEQLVLAGKIFSYDSVFYEKIYTAYISRADSCLKKDCETKLLVLSALSFPQIKENLMQKLMLNRIQIPGTQEINSTNSTSNSTNSTDNSIECFSRILNSSCEVNSTTLALLILNDADKIKTLSWLNSQSLNTEEKAFVAYASDDLTLTNQIVSLQSQSGWFPVSSTNYKESPITTAKTIFLLNHMSSRANNSNVFLESMQKAEGYLKNKFYNQNILVKEYLLFFGFDKNKIEPMMGIWPGIAETKSRGSFDLILKNNAQNGANFTIGILNSNIVSFVNGKTIKKVTISMPFVGTQDASVIKEDLKIMYHPAIGGYEKEYSIPLIIRTEKSSTNITGGNVNSSFGEINETQIPEELDYNQTGIETPLISSQFSFIEKEIALNLSNLDPKQIIKINLENNFNGEVKEIYITQSSSLITLVPIIEPSSISSVLSGEKSEIEITIDPSNAFIEKEYSGEIIARGVLNNQNIEARIPLKIQMSVQNNLKNCSQFGGKECGTEEICSGNITTATDTVSCCLADCKTKSGSINQVVGFIILGVLIAILVLVFMWMKKRQKKENAPFIQEAQKQYEKTFQRPASHLNQ